MFGRIHRWDIPVGEVVVADTTYVSYGDPQQGWVFRDPPRIPYAATATSRKSPNLLLLFRRPQRIPPLRVGGAMTLGLPYRASRSPGVDVDGVNLRAAKPRDAIGALAAAGVTRVERPTEWLRENRPITSDPAAVRALARNQRRGTWFLAVFVLVVAFLAAAVAVNVTGLWTGPVSRWLLNVSLTALLGGFVLLCLANLWLGIRNRRRRRSDDRSDPDRTETRQL
jgi:hypothetical protein